MLVFVRREKILRFIGTVLLPLALLVGLAVGLWWLATALWSQASKIDTNVWAAIISGLAIAAAALLTKHIEHKHSVEAQFRNDKVKQYNQFLETFDKINDGQITSNELIRTMNAWKRESMLWGSPKVMNGFMYLSDLDTGNKTVGEMANSMEFLGTLLLAMRKDVGLSNFHLAKKRPSGISKEVALGASYWMRDADAFMECLKTNPAKRLADLDNEVARKRTSP